jgi:hypothetical protein
MYLTCRASGFCFGAVQRGLKKVVDIKRILLGRFKHKLWWIYISLN